VKTRLSIARLLSFVVLALFVLVLPAALQAQSCALCYTQAASSGARMIQALRSGILILIVPPTLATVVLIFVVHHKRNQIRHGAEAEGPSRDW
jgi:hypothetical protein